MAAAAAICLALLAGCETFERDARLEACWVGRHANVATATLELPAAQVAQRYGLDPLANPELVADQMVFVVVYAKGAVVPREANGQIVNFYRSQALCVWFNDRTVVFYDEVGLGPGPER